MKKTILLITLFFISYISIANEPEQEYTEEQLAYFAEMQKIADSINKQTGTITLPGNKIQLDVPEGFYYLSAQDADKILVDLWGNPPGQTTLGMLFPAKYSVLDAEAWGVTLEYEETGYISDEDAQDIDYQDMLKDMKADTKEWNKERAKQGYELIELIGWAAPPKYDAQNKKLHWAKELKFGEQEENTLNYNVRVLGRQGVLNMNFIAGMTQLNDIESNINSVMHIAHFKPGHTYAEFNPEYDKVAAYGIGALVAGKVAAKTGLFAALLLIIKKFWFVIIAGFIWLGKLFTNKKNKADSDQ
ncbi:MAG: DUF2167 domain-containing protein [Kangiellaceae bacterium]|nr:DUF2167 domain-containing protein [Kangiellaceae bacterium]